MEFITCCISASHSGFLLFAAVVLLADSKVRVATLEVAVQVLRQVSGVGGEEAPQTLVRAPVLPDDTPLRKDSTDTDGHSVDMPVADAERREGSDATTDRTRSRPVSGNRSALSDEHLAVLEGAREEATLVLRNFYKVSKLITSCFEGLYHSFH